MHRTIPLTAALLPLSFAVASAQSDDKRNVMLNAESATIPREINVGLPDSGNGASVFIDGMLHAFGLPRSQYHWSGGNAYAPVRTIGLMEATVLAGDFGVIVDSRTLLGGDKVSGAVTGTTSINGLIRFDGAVRGPISKGWYFALGAYANYDPTSVNSPSRHFVEQKQIYQAALTKRWKENSLSLLYRFSICDDRIDGGYSVAPFIYNGDGSIGTAHGFALGRSCYMPADETVRWMDVVDGSMRSGDMAKMDRRRLHDISALYTGKSGSGWDIEAGVHLCYMAPSEFMKVSLAGIDSVLPAQGYTLSDGGAFSGNIQNRLAMVYGSRTIDTEMRFLAKKSFEKHLIEAGISAVHARQMESGSSFQFAHTVEASPQRVYLADEPTWNFNRNSTYIDGSRTHMALFAFESWRPVRRLLLRSGIRLKPLYYVANSAARKEGESINTRVEGFNLRDDSIAKVNRFTKGGLDFVLSQHVSWTLAEGLSIMAEGFYSMTEKTATYYKNPTLPSLKAIGNATARAGITYNGASADATLLFSYITSWNNAAPVSVTKQIGGISETIPWTAEYGIGTPGVTFDGNIRRGGFSFHARATWQNPQYKSYRNEFVFSDGSTEILDYTGNTVTGISRLMIEADPSFSFSAFRLWASVRYYSRQYVSRTNLAYFDGHFETFAGADWNFLPAHKVSVNFVNVLAQAGAKGSIDIADTIQDSSALKGLLMAGSYIRPFTVDLSYTWQF